MDIKDRYMKLWPFYSMPTGSRGVVSQFGKIVGIEQEGLALRQNAYAGAPIPFLNVHKQ